MTPGDDLELLRRDIAIRYVISGSGRIERGPFRPSGPRQESVPPERSGGPRLHFAGCADGALAHLRHDVDDEIAARVLSFTETAPPWSDPDTPPAGLDAILALLSRGTASSVDGPEIVFRLPNGLACDHGARLVACDTAAGEALLARLARGGVPPSLLEAGFLELGDFWWPWCVALDGDDIAAMAFAANLGQSGAEIGVFTFPGFRGRGFAAAATAGWASLESLEGRELIYSTRLTNASSRRVADRLGLRPAGARVRVTDA
ncbi:MAG TPA: GNAT family N-acetyltransferase [Caulobacteraceae bacterium]|nr:GNAT family N-acetyltransferase [Caulobacteraceae bacterium]